MKVEVKKLKNELEAITTYLSITSYELLDVIRTLPEFSCKIMSYVSWREASQNNMIIYTINSLQYSKALTVLRNLIIGEVNELLTSHTTALNFEAGYN